MVASPAGPLASFLVQQLGLAAFGSPAATLCPPFRKRPLNVLVGEL
jgi:hypothetical protein